MGLPEHLNPTWEKSAAIWSAISKEKPHDQRAKHDNYQSQDGQRVGEL